MKSIKNKSLFGLIIECISSPVLNFMDYPHEAAVIYKKIGAPGADSTGQRYDMTQGPYRPGKS